MKICDLVRDFLPVFVGERKRYPGIIVQVSHTAARILWNDSTISWREIRHLELLSEYE